MTWSDTRDLAFHAGVVCTGLWAVRCAGGVVIGETFPRHKHHWTLQAALKGRCSYVEVPLLLPLNSCSFDLAALPCDGTVAAQYCVDMT